MEIYSFKNVNFTYPDERNRALCDLSFAVAQGEFIILCGSSGCGKTTLLRHFKTCLTPHGEFSGEIYYKGKALSEITQREQAANIGFVLQSPENQVVTDKVWHELAFSLESLGYDTAVIRRRVAETAAFFGIENWFYKDVAELSGGQKQLLALASVMIMQPEIVILDEPTSQLDPIAAADFFAMLGKINRELGTTIVLTEHRLEEAIPFSTRVIVMEQGKIICDGESKQVGMQLKNSANRMFLAMPAAMQLWAALETQLECPVTVRDGRGFLEKRVQEKPLLPCRTKHIYQYDAGNALECDDLCFRYEKNSPDVLKGFSLKLRRGEFYTLLGGNGAGKTTALKVIAGLKSAYRGTVKVNGKIGCLAQSPKALFVKRTLREDLYEAFSGADISKTEQTNRIFEVVEICGLNHLLDRHPYDLSGGEQQRAALAKVLLTKPDILLLDEPTKGFDAQFKRTFAQILQRLLSQGITVFMISHDVAFCAEYAHRCGLFFDGVIVSEGTSQEFFSGNNYYTTAANRMARQFIPAAVTVSDIIACCGGTVQRQDEFITEKPLPKSELTVEKQKPATMSVWRKITAAISLIISLGVLFYAANITDLSAVINANGVSEQGYRQLTLYTLVVVSLAIFIAAIGKRKAIEEITYPVSVKYKLSKRTKVAAALILLFIPMTILGGLLYLGNKYYNIISFAVLTECMLPFFLIFEDRKPKARELVTIAVLCAIGIAGRSAFFMLPQFKPVMAITVISGVALGGEVGFLVGAVTMLASNMMFSQGPWTPWQMFAMGITGFLAGVLFKKGFIRRNRESMAAFGSFSAIVIYGGIMNPAAAIIYNQETVNLKMLAAYYISGLPMDLIHAAATAMFLLIAAGPMLEKLDRVKIKYGLME